MDYSQVCRLFESKATKDMVDRQVAVLRRIARLNPDGCVVHVGWRGCVDGLRDIHSSLLPKIWGKTEPGKVWIHLFSARRDVVVCCGCVLCCMYVCQVPLCRAAGRADGYGTRQ